MLRKILALGFISIFILPFGNTMILKASETCDDYVITSQQHMTTVINKTDLIVACYHNLTVLFGDGTGGFLQRNDYLKGDGQADVIAEDFNCDGFLDVAATGYWGDVVSVGINDGLGGFSELTNYTVGTTVTALDCGDLNEDGFLDIVVCNSEDALSITILFGDGAGGFGNRYDFFDQMIMTDIAVADFDNDTHLDIAVTQFPLQNVFVLFGDGSGIFVDYDTYPVGVDPFQITCGDVNNDGWEDILVTNYDQYNVGSIKVLLNNGAGLFTSQFEYEAGYGTVGIVTGYFNNDSFLDVAVTNFIDGTLMVFLNDGGGSFDILQEIFIGDMPYGLTSADFNRDSIVDLAVAISEEDTVCILFGTGAGLFFVNRYLPVGVTPYALIATNVNPTSGDPSLSIEIQEKKIIVTNAGDADAEQVRGQIIVTGGIFGLINKQTNFSSEILLVNDKLIIPIPSIVGLGAFIVDIWVEASNSERVQTSAKGFVILFWMILK